MFSGRPVRGCQRCAPCSGGRSSSPKLAPSARERQIAKAQRQKEESTEVNMLLNAEWMA